MKTFTNGLTAAQRERLEILIEEAGEIVQAGTKILRHGYDSFHPLRPTVSNKQLLEEELAELLGVLNEMCTQSDLDGSVIEHQRITTWAAKLPYTHHQAYEDEGKRRTELWRKPMRDWTDEELDSERIYYQRKIDAAPGWGAAVGEYQKNVFNIIREQNIRLAQRK